MTINSLMIILIRFLVFFIFFIGVLELLFYLLLDKKKNNDIKGFKVNIFGLLMEINNSMTLALSVSFLRFIFIIWTIFDSASISIVHITILFTLSVLYGVFTKSIKNIIFESLSSVALYYSLISSRLLTSYLVDIRYEWYVFLGDIMLKVFIILYSTIFLLRNIINAVLKTKHIRRDRNAEI